MFKLLYILACYFENYLALGSFWIEMEVGIYLMIERQFQPF